MKNKIIIIWAFLVAAGLFLVSCGQEGGEVLEIALQVAPTSLELDPQGGQEYLTVTSNEDWLLRSDVKWVKAVAAYGKASADPVKASITFEANTSGAAREGKLIVKTLSGKTAEVKISQAVLDGPVS